ncbi:MAG: acyltransferase family protein [Actinomycetes bacterium]
MSLFSVLQAIPSSGLLVSMPQWERMSASLTDHDPESGRTAAEALADSQVDGPLIRFRPDIQGLRAIAVLLVVFDHLDVPGFGSGFIGVDVFFVISGFLITALLAAEYLRHVDAGARGRISIRGFYRRRILRILPAATLTIAAVLLLGKLTLGRIQFIRLQSDALWATFFATNIQLIHQASDYFQRGLSESPLQNFWSLAVEEQFYLVWPVCFALVAFACTRFIRRVGWLGGVRAAVLLIGLASFIWSVQSATSDPAGGYYSTLTRAWQLALGAAIALTPALAKVFKGRVADVAGICGIALLAGGLAFCDASSGYPGAQGLLPTLGAGLLICAGLTPEASNPAGWALSARLPRFFGRISYSLYLWHWPIIVFAGILYGTSSGRPWVRVGLFAGAVIVATLSQRLIERPFVGLAHGKARGDGSHRRRPALRRALMVALVGFNLVVIAAFARPISHSIAPLPPGGAEWTKAETLGAVSASRNHRRLTANEVSLGQRLFEWQMLGVHTADRNFLQDAGTALEKRCPDSTTITSYRQATNCTRRGLGYGHLRWPSGVKPLVAIVGNSFALQWVYEVQRLLPKNVRLMPLTITSCQPWTVGDTGQVDSHGNNCDAHRMLVNRVLNRKRPGLVIASYQRVRQGSRQLQETTPFITRLLKESPRVLFIGPSLVMPAYEDCLKADRLASRCNRLLSTADRRADFELGTAVRAGGGNYVSTQSRICSKNFCPSFLRGYPMRSDGIHFSRWAVRALAPWVEEAIQRSVDRSSR